MAEILNKEKNNLKKGIKYKLILIESLIITLPFLIIVFIIYQGQYSPNLSHIILLAIIFVLIIIGMIIVRQIFEKISTVASVMKKVETGSLASVEIKKDIAELHDITISFNQLARRLEQTTEELNSKSLELLTIKELSEMAQKSLHMNDLMELLLDKSMMLTGADIGSIFMVDETSNRFQIIASKCSGNDVPIGSYINIDDSVVKPVVFEQKPLLVEDIAKDVRTLKPNDNRYGSPSFLSMPIIVRNKVVFILNLTGKKNGHIFDIHDDHTLSIMLAEIIFAIENSILHREAAERLKEIETHNIRLQKEINNRIAAEEEQVALNKKIEEANRQLGLAYAKMKESRDKLIGNLFNEELGFILSADGIIQGVTERAIEHTHKARNVLIGSSMNDLLNESSRNVLTTELKQAWKGMVRSIPVELSDEFGVKTSFEMKLTRLSLDDKRFLLAILH